MVVPQLADTIVTPAPERYPLQEAARADREWQEILLDEEVALDGDLCGDFLGVGPAAQRRALLRQLHARLADSYRFARLTSTTVPGRRYALAAPFRIRERFKERGVPVDDRTSRLLWRVARVSFACHAWGRTLLNALAAVLDGMQVGKEAAEDQVLFMGLSPGELRGTRGDLNALDYVRERRLELFRPGRKIFVYTPWLDRSLPVDDIPAVLCRDPFREMARRRLPFSAIVETLSESMSVAARIGRDLFGGDGNRSFLCNEYAALPRVKQWFRAAVPSAIVATNSMYNSQPLWMDYAAHRNCETAMLFYSTNSLPFYLEGEPDPALGDPAYRLLDYERFEVWTEGQKRWLIGMGVPVRRVIASGIIIWGRYDALRLPRAQFPRAAKRVVVFDVVPMAPEFWLRRGVGEIYYDFDRMTRFLTDVVDAVAVAGGAPVEVFLKSKRPHQMTHDVRYWEVVDQLVAAGRLALLPSTGSPIDAVAGSDIVVSAPFSSPSVIAETLMIPTCFYDPSGRLRLPPIQVSPAIPLIRGPQDLETWMREKLGQRAIAQSRESRLRMDVS